MAENRLKSGALLVAAVVLGISLAVILYFYQIFYKAEHFLPGVCIGSVSVEGLSRDQAMSVLQENIKRLASTPITFFSNDYIYDTVMAELCQPVNVKSVIDQIWEKERKRSLHSKIFNMDGSQPIVYPLKAEYNPTGLAHLLEEWNQNLGIEAVNARLEIDRSEGLVVLPSQTGRTVDEASFAALPQDYSEFKPLKLPIILKEKPPAITEEELKDMGQLSTYTTWFNAGDINRSHNLYLATAAINTSIIAPGEVFSFNKKVGQRVYEAGYRDALVIVGGKFEPGLGGGVCQVSSTLYNACLLAGMKIVERYNHALTVAYVPVGRDATVVYGLQDFRFKNVTRRPIYISALAQGGRLSITLYGNLHEKKKIELSSIIDQTIPFKEVREIDPTLETGQEKVDHVGFPGYVVRSFRSFLDSDGKVIEQEKLATDHYKPLDKLILTGPPGPDEIQEKPPGDEQVDEELPVDVDKEPEPLPQTAVPGEQLPENALPDNSNQIGL